MTTLYQTSLFIFHRDLRIQDNTGLIAALNQSEQVIPCFIFDPRQVDDKNHYRSINAIQFMIESLHDLEQNLHTKKGKLYLFYGKAEEIIEMLLKKKIINAVFCNRDYTPFSIKRDEQIKKQCLHYNVAFHQYHDLLLHEPEEIVSQSGTPYVKFTPFFKQSHLKQVAEPVTTRSTHFYIKPIVLAQTATIYKKILAHNNPQIHIHGGRTQAMRILNSLHKFEHYAHEHDYPALDATNLSAHNKFGTVSIREVYYAIAQTLGKDHPLIRQLYWRDFFTHVAYFSPFVFGQSFNKRYDTIKWNMNKKAFKAWCEGVTGFPIVDAGMRQLNETGFMHNRARLIVGSFLTKDLHIDWRWGENYFAQKLIDYDPSVNNGNWQWVASTGCDAQPYFRIFNPWLQQKKFDPDCVYIKRWIPELKNVSPTIIHTWYTSYSSMKTNYPQPMLDHAKESTAAKKLYKNAAYND